MYFRKGTRARSLKQSSMMKRVIIIKMNEQTGQKRDHSRYRCRLSMGFFNISTWWWVAMVLSVESEKNLQK